MNRRTGNPFGSGGPTQTPTLFTTQDVAAIPAWVRATVLDEHFSGIETTVHEFGHQYFQGMIATREHLEPWLDEGIDEMSNTLALMDRYGADAWRVRLLGQKLLARDAVRLGVGAGRLLWPVDQPAGAFARAVGGYGSTVYGRTQALMLTLRNLAGADAFDQALRVYSDRHRFRHPRGSDLEAVLVEELGERLSVGPADAAVELDVGDYLEQALRTTRRVDFAVVSVDNRQAAGQAGWHRGATGELEHEELAGEDEEGDSEDAEDAEDDEDDEDDEGVVVVHRAGAFRLPVELLVEFADGSEERLVWDARAATAVFEWPGRKVRRATLDPDHKLLLEQRRLDNTAFAGDLDESDGLSRPLGGLVEAFSLAISGAFGP